MKMLQTTPLSQLDQGKDLSPEIEALKKEYGFGRKYTGEINNTITDIVDTLTPTIVKELSEEDSNDSLKAYVQIFHVLSNIITAIASLEDNTNTIYGFQMKKLGLNYPDIQNLLSSFLGNQDRQIDIYMKGEYQYNENPTIIIKDGEIELIIPILLKEKYENGIFRAMCSSYCVKKGEDYALFTIYNYHKDKYILQNSVGVSIMSGSENSASDKLLQILGWRNLNFYQHSQIVS